MVIGTIGATCEELSARSADEISALSVDEIEGLFSESAPSCAGLNATFVKLMSGWFSTSMTDIPCQDLQGPNQPHFVLQHR